MKEQFIQDAENKFGELITNEMTRIDKMKRLLLEFFLVTA